MPHALRIHCTLVSSLNVPTSKTLAVHLLLPKIRFPTHITTKNKLPNHPTSRSKATLAEKESPKPGRARKPLNTYLSPSLTSQSKSAGDHSNFSPALLKSFKLLPKGNSRLTCACRPVIHTTSSTPTTETLDSGNDRDNTGHSTVNGSSAGTAGR